MPLADVGDLALHYEIDGDGPPCLVLHGGLGLDHVLYRRTLGPLTATRQAVFYDHRANGRSTGAAAGTITMEQLADDAAALAAALGFDRCAVLGHSYGGFVAQELALRHPGLVERLVLVSTTPGQRGSTEDPDAEQGPPPPREFVEMASTIPATDAELEAGMTALLPFYFHRTPIEDVLPLAAGTIHRVDALVRGFEVLATWSSYDRLPGVTAPTLVLAGRHDVITSPPQSERIASQIPDATRAVLDHSGHFPWIEEPAAFFDVVGAFLS
jgi:proline iminopeptidase